MKDFLWQFAYNLHIPLTIVAIVIGIVCYNVAKSSYNGMKHLTSVEEKYGILEWRMWTAANVAAVMAILWLLAMAVPSPTFKKETTVRVLARTVERKVVVPVVKYEGQRVVYKMPTYLGAFEACRTALTNANPEIHLDQTDVVLCDKMAKEAALPPYRSITRTIHEPSNFWDIFNKCNEAYDIEQDKPGVVERRNQRIAVCKDVAATAARN
jgi:hypothetical protein